MKKFFKTLAVGVLVALPLYASMSDPSALKLAKTTWGDVAMIGQRRDMTASNWTKLVGYKSPMCVNDFTVVGSGFSTWDAAFADAQAHPAAVGGPFKGIVTVQVNAWDNVALSSVQFYIDGNAIAMAKTPQPPVSMLVATWDVDTTMLTNGYHVLCAQAVDTSMLTGKSYDGYLFKVDQTAGAAGQLWFPGSLIADARPAFSFWSNLIPILQK